MAFGTGYITATEFKDVLLGLSLTSPTTISDADLDKYIKDASRLADAYANVPGFGSTEQTEKHEWRPGSRRVYVRKWPVAAVSAIAIRVSASQTFTLSTSDVIVNNTLRYIEIEPLAMALGISPTDIPPGGIVTPLVEITYTAGYATIPDEVKLAVAIIVGALIAQRRLAEEGIAGILSFTIGSYMVTVGRGQDDAAGFAGYIPNAAKELLNGYRMTTVR